MSWLIHTSPSGNLCVVTLNASVINSSMSFAFTQEHNLVYAANKAVLLTVDEEDIWQLGIIYAFLF